MGTVVPTSDSARNLDGDKPSVGEKAFGGICGLRCIEDGNDDDPGGELPVCEKRVVGY